MAIINQQSTSNQQSETAQQDTTVFTFNKKELENLVQTVRRATIDNSIDLSSYHRASRARKFRTTFIKDYLKSE